MNVILGLFLAAIVTIFVLYPAILFVDTMLETHDFQHRLEEWRELVAQQIIVEWQMLCQINEVRRKFGMAPLPQHAIIEQFKGFGGWTGLRIKIEQSVRLAIQKLTWI